MLVDQPKFDEAPTKPTAEHKLLAELFKALVTSEDSKTIPACAMTLFSAAVTIARYANEKQRRWIRAHAMDELSEIDREIN